MHCQSHLQETTCIAATAYGSVHPLGGCGSTFRALHDGTGLTGSSSAYTPCGDWDNPIALHGRVRLLSWQVVGCGPAGLLHGTLQHLRCARVVMRAAEGAAGACNGGLCAALQLLRWTFMESYGMLLLWTFTESYGMLLPWTCMESYGMLLIGVVLAKQCAARRCVQDVPCPPLSAILGVAAAALQAFVPGLFLHVYTMLSWPAELPIVAGR